MDTGDSNGAEQSASDAAQSSYQHLIDADPQLISFVLAAAQGVLAFILLLILVLAADSGPAPQAAAAAFRGKQLVGTWKRDDGILLSIDEQGLAALHKEGTWGLERWRCSVQPFPNMMRVKFDALEKNDLMPPARYALVKLLDTQTMEMSERSTTHWPMRLDGGGRVVWRRLNSDNPVYYTRTDPRSEAYFNRFLPTYPNAKLVRSESLFIGGLTWEFQTAAAAADVARFYRESAQRNGWSVNEDTWRARFMPDATFLSMSRGPDFLMLTMRRKAGALHIEVWLHGGEESLWRY